jgi:hypothetical protein
MTQPDLFKFGCDPSPQVLIMSPTTGPTNTAYLSITSVDEQAILSFAHGLKALMLPTGHLLHLLPAVNETS